MAEVTMTPMRRNAISILNRIPEERLTVVVQFMLNIDEDNELIARLFEGLS